MKKQSEFIIKASKSIKKNTGSLRKFATHTSLFFFFKWQRCTYAKLREKNQLRSQRGKQETGTPACLWIDWIEIMQSSKVAEVVKK